MELRRPRRRRPTAAVQLLLLMTLPLADAHGQAEPRYAPSVMNTLNTTGRSVDLPVPLKEDKRDLGEIIIRLNRDDSVLIHRETLLRVANPIFSAAMLEAIRGFPGTFVSIDALAGVGIDVTFD